MTTGMFDDDPSGFTRQWRDGDEEQSRLRYERRLNYEDNPAPFWNPWPGDKPPGELVARYACPTLRQGEQVIVRLYDGRMVQAQDTGIWWWVARPAAGWIPRRVYCSVRQLADGTFQAYTFF